MVKRKPRPGGASGIVARDVMVRDVVTVSPETPIDDVGELFQVRNINGAPVVDGSGHLVGIVTEDDLIFGQMGMSDEELASMSPGKARSAPVRTSGPRRVSEVMTANPIAAEEETAIEDICGLMWRLKIHRVPIVAKGKVTGIVSTTDMCRLVAEGLVQLVRRAGVKKG